MASTKAPKSRSLELRLTSGPGTVFLKSQFCTKPQRILLTPETPLAGKTALITGATTGIGLHAARQLLSLELSRIILAVRSVEKGELVASQLRSTFPTATIDIWPLEMTSYESIQALARRVSAELSRLDIAILNAGLVHAEFTRSPSTGHCDIIQVNYLSTVLLSILLLPALHRHGSSRDSPARLVIVNSGTALMTKLPNCAQRPFLSSFDNPASFDPTEHYSASKALGHLFLVRPLGHLPPGFGDFVAVTLVCPGLCRGSGLHREASGMIGAFMGLLKPSRGELWTKAPRRMSMRL